MHAELVLITLAPNAKLLLTMLTFVIYLPLCTKAQTVCFY